MRACSPGWRARHARARDGIGQRSLTEDTHPPDPGTYSGCRRTTADGKGRPRVSKPSRHLRTSMLWTGIVFVAQDQERADIGLGADEFRTRPQAPLLVEIRPTNRRRPCKGRVAVRGESRQKIPDRQNVALSFHQNVRPSRSTGHLIDPRSRRRSPSVVINSSSLRRPFATASRCSSAIPPMRVPLLDRTTTRTSSAFTRFSSSGLWVVRSTWLRSLACRRQSIKSGRAPG